MKTRILIVLAVIGLFSAAFLFSCAKKAKTESLKPDDNSIPVKVVAATYKSATDIISASGFISSETEARLSFKTGGIIKHIYVKEGQAVKKGQLLATLDLTEINSMVAQAEQGLEKAERDYKRAENLYKDTVASMEQYQNAATALKIAKEQLQIAKFNQSYSEIRASYDGKVVKKIMNEGEIAGPGMPVFFMNSSSASDWVVKVGIPDKEWARLHIGDKAKVKIDAYPDEVFQATVSQLSQAPDPMSGLYQAELKLVKNSKALATGLFSKAQISPTGSSQYVSVPIDAIIEGNGNSASIFVAEGNKAKRVPVTIAFIKEGQVMLADGLEKGAQVIVDGSAYLTDSATINIVQ
ncbi:MAG: efflux RND transporter periplasmic adaptor subunit [Chitinophagales bacterium]|nr:efflux RND transporter periplasmic adaptor subunit [Chitinophagales bacterium]